jgi:hypothetical protein
VTSAVFTPLLLCLPLAKGLKNAKYLKNRQFSWPSWLLVAREIAPSSDAPIKVERGRGQQKKVTGH